MGCTLQELEPNQRQPWVSIMRRFIGKRIKPSVEWLANTGLLGETITCGLIDWTLRNEGRYANGPTDTHVKSTSVLRDQYGRYVAICHWSVSEENDHAMLWDPGDDLSPFGFTAVDGSVPAIHSQDQTFIISFAPHRPIVIHRAPPGWRARRPTLTMRGIVVPRPLHHLNFWQFFIEQDETLYAYERFDVSAFADGKTQRPRVYEPVTHRSRWITPTERISAQSMKEDFRIMDEITVPFEFVQNYQTWLDNVTAIYDEHFNDPDTHQRLSKGLARLTVTATEAIESRWYDRRQWEYMGHIAMDIFTRELDHDMFSVPDQLYQTALANAEPFGAYGLLPNFEVEAESKHYMYKIIAGLSRETRSHLLTFQRKPKRVRPTTQRKFQNCQTCRHWARASKTVGNCRSEAARMKILCVNNDHQEGTQGHTPVVFKTHPAFGCTEYSPKE